MNSLLQKFRSNSQDSYVDKKTKEKTISKALKTTDLKSVTSSDRKSSNRLKVPTAADKKLSKTQSAIHLREKYLSEQISHELEEDSLLNVTSNGIHKSSSLRDLSEHFHASVFRTHSQEVYPQDRKNKKDL